MMTQAAPRLAAARRERSVAYVAPFLAFIAWIAADGWLAVGLDARYALRSASALLLMLVFSRQVIQLKPRYAWQSVLLGMAVFAIWVGPDVLWPAYRHSWLFDNRLTGSALSSVPKDLRINWAFIAVRVAGSVLLVPILEELFWRGWLMRWLIHKDFSKVPMGKYAPAAFWTVAVLFASEHGPYWDVGLAAGIAYNWWMVRGRSLADCILAHAVTNACLAAYVLSAGHWQYWL